MTVYAKVHCINKTASTLKFVTTCIAFFLNFFYVFLNCLFDFNCIWDIDGRFCVKATAICEVRAAKAMGAKICKTGAATQDMSVARIATILGAEMETDDTSAVSVATSAASKLLDVLRSASEYVMFEREAREYYFHHSLTHEY